MAHRAFGRGCRRVGGLILLLAAIVAVPLGCKPKAGDKCSGNKATCASTSAGLFCFAGKLQEMSCQGPLGCFTKGSRVECDNSVASVKDGCNEENDGACALDHKALLQCKNGAFVLSETCKGARGCEIVNGDRVTCDNDIADEGDPCRVNGDYACTSDKSMVLKCVNQQMTDLNSCRGPKACRVFEIPEQHKVEFVCDESVSQLNDPCDTDNEESCSTDRKSLFSCHSNKYVLAKSCPGPNGCNFDERSRRHSCDTSGSAGGAAAAGSGSAATAGSAAPTRKKKGK
jgi:hypothetical protein